MAITNPKLDRARELYAGGQQRDAAVLFTEIMNETKDPTIFLNAVLGFVISESRLNAGMELLRRTDQGIQVAQQLKTYDTLAYLMSTKAQFLSDELGFMEHEQNNIVLTPDWVQFSLERDQKLYTEIQTKSEKYRKEIDELYSGALHIVQQINDKSVEGHVYSQLGQHYSSEYLRIRSKCIGKNDRFRFLYKFHFILHRGYDRYFMYSKECRKKLRASIKSSITNYQKAIECHRSTDDKDSEAYAYYNFAIHLGTFAMFRKAARALDKAEGLARELDNKALLGRIHMLRKSHKTKNSDTPNYLEGETRDIEGDVLKFIADEKANEPA